MTVPAELAAWTPVALSLDPPAPALDWGDLRGIRFQEPFFGQTVERWAGGDPAPLVRTGLDALLPLDQAPSLDPSLLIFHFSRCGSTLLSRLLSCLPGVLVVSEPAPLNALLDIDPARVDPAVQATVLRLLARALGRRRFGDERHYVLKLSSWNIRYIALFRRAFPGVPALWVQREPAEIMASLLAIPAGWSRLRKDPRRAAALFGISDPGLAEDEFLAQALAAMLATAAGPQGPEHVIDYRDLPEGAWTRVAPLLGMTPDSGMVARLREEAAYSAKEPGRQRFAGDSPERSALVETMRGLAETWLLPGYRALDRMRAAA